MEKPLGCYLQVQSPYYQVAHYNQETPFLVSSRGQVKSEEAKKRIKGYVITATTSFHPPKPVSTDLTITSDSVSDLNDLLT